MRRVILLGLLAVTTLPAGAAKPGPVIGVTVAQLEQSLTVASASKKSDAAIARMIGGMELSERLTEPTLERLSANLKADSKAAPALRLLADQSTFHQPPPDCGRNWTDGSIQLSAPDTYGYRLR